MDISKYTAFFHDGAIRDIDHKHNKMELSMESAEMDKDDVKENIPLSKYDTIQGKLYTSAFKNW